jgi:hypothetical protein
MNGQYMEVVCPLDHPATQETPWGKAVSKKVSEGGGWLTWVFSTKDITKIASRFGREAVEGHRMRPNGSDLKWQQIGVKEIAETRHLPFFIEWLSLDHPSQDGTPIAEIEKIVIADATQLSDSWFKDEIIASLGSIKIEWIDPSQNDNQSGIVSVHLKTPMGVVALD